MNTQKPLVSVLMAVWNRVNLVPNAIQSIFDQTFRDWELVIIDDGSDDGTQQYLDKLVKKCDEVKKEKVRVFKTKHSGLVKALNFGHEQCEGKIIVKQDSDDLSLPNRLERIVNYWDKHNKTDFFYHGFYQTFNDDNETIRRIYKPALPIKKERLIKEQYIPGFYAYTKEFARQVPYRDGIICSEDWMLIMDAYLKNKKIGFIDEGLYEYVLRTDSNSQINEGTGSYESDEEIIKNILSEEYKINNFSYGKRG